MARADGGWTTQIPDYEPFPSHPNYQGYTFQVQKRFQDRWFPQRQLHLVPIEGELRGRFGRVRDGWIPALHQRCLTTIPLAIYNRYRYGLLPQDRTHVIKIQTGYQWDNGFGGGALRDSGQAGP